MAILQKNERITSADHFQDTRHIEFELGEAGPTYDAGDIISIVPHQDDAAVHKLLKMMGHSPNCRVQIELYEAKDNQTCQMEVRGLPTSLRIQKAFHFASARI